MGWGRVAVLSACYLICVHLCVHATTTWQLPAAVLLRVCDSNHFRSSPSIMCHCWSPQFTQTGLARHVRCACQHCLAAGFTHCWWRGHKQGSVHEGEPPRCSVPETCSSSLHTHRQSTDVTWPHCWAATDSVLLYLCTHTPGVITPTLRPPLPASASCTTAARSAEPLAPSCSWRETGSR